MYYLECSTKTLRTKIHSAFNDSRITAAYYYELCNMYIPSFYYLKGAYLDLYRSETFTVKL